MLKEKKINNAAQESPLLRVAGISVRFGGITALDNVSFDVDSGDIVGLIGPNGAGKTTLFNCLSRLYAFDAGSLFFKGVSLAAVPRHGIAALGIGRTFQNLALFRSMSVRQNILLGGHCRLRSGFFANALGLPRVRREEEQLSRYADELIDFLDLHAVAGMPVIDLPFAVQKRVELGRTLASRPELLLLDEPAGGLNHAEVEALIDLLRDIRERHKLTILLVEHHMNMVMRISDKVVVLDFGCKIADGTPEMVKRNPAVIKAYLGTNDCMINNDRASRRS